MRSTESSSLLTPHRLAEHLQAVCNGLNDDVFDATQLFPHSTSRSVVHTDSDEMETDEIGGECVFKLQDPLFSTGDNIIHIKQNKVSWSLLLLVYSTRDTYPNLQYLVPNPQLVIF